MPKYKRIIVLISIIGVMATSMISVITSCSSSSADTHIEQTNKGTKNIKKENAKDNDNYRKAVIEQSLRQELSDAKRRTKKNVVFWLCAISMAQDEFKKQRVKDQNKNGIGEYASNTELIDFLKAEREKKSEFSKRLLLNDSDIGEGGNFIRDGIMFMYLHRIFIPEEPDMQEQYWLARAIRDPKDPLAEFGLPEFQHIFREASSQLRRSYFYYNKIDMIFYTDCDLSEAFELELGLDKDKEYQDPWTLKRIFFEEPFKSPINTVIWKVLGMPH
ncbi:MAG: hypothetical protein V1709_06375 [Planctomycetota bacterium]